MQRYCTDPRPPFDRQQPAPAELACSGIPYTHRVIRQGRNGHWGPTTSTIFAVTLYSVLYIVGRTRTQLRGFDSWGTPGRTCSHRAGALLACFCPLASQRARPDGCRTWTTVDSPTLITAGTQLCPT